ncbi:hypothetical protein KI688_007349 [Linnemannia hyalina]|uniref:60S ribosomal protein L29 n=2 Tax=Linnemannia TaxID=2779861 RepID=A0ABQ7K9W4_9FUNG|nr:hypothetical protein BGX30_002743 [Mortierella sp. GBA39]KAG0293995.1 hypothetical protein BGZ96_001907 [Linnemannia gamsii]KAG9061371.1 hypothetical protein KI688_007349 [Linnemannia hyalina]
MVACMTAAASAPLVPGGAKPAPETNKQLPQLRELSDEAIKALLSKTRKNKKSRLAGKHSGTSPLLRQVLRRSLLGHIGKHQQKGSA